MSSFLFHQTPLEGLLIVEPHIVISDDGYSMITYNKEFSDYIRHIDGSLCKYVQDNESMSRRGVLRGIHTQLHHPQGKLVRVTYGQIFDAVVDVHKNSPTFVEWFGVFLSSFNRKMLLVLEGFLHGFLVISDEAVFQYKCTRFYEPTDEFGGKWNDPEIGIKWPMELIEYPSLSDKNKNNISFKEMCSLIE